MNIDQNGNTIDEFFDDFLEHYGIEGQKWGHRRGPPYPLDSDKDVQRILKKKAKLMKRKVKKEAKEKARQEKKSRSIESKKRKWAQDPDKLYKHRRQFTESEISDALRTFDWDRKILNYSVENKKSFAERAKSFADTTTSIATVAKNTTTGYNVIAGFVNAFDASAKPMKYIELPGGGKKKDK